MTEQEKIIFDILNRFDPFSDGINFVDNVTDALLKAFPQITKKPVPIVKIPSLNGLFGIKFYDVNGSGNERQEWIDSHYVEVINE